MQGRSFFQDIGEFANYLNAQNQRTRAQQLQEQHLRQQQQQQQMQREREQQQQRRQQQQQQRQPQQETKKQQKDQGGGGFGYFIAALAGVAAGFIAKSLFSEEETPKPQRPQEQYNQGNYYNQNPNPQPADPADAELEECTDLVCPITLELMREPMISKKCGHSFEKDAILSWTATRSFCPKCHTPLQQSDLVKNYSLKNAIEYMRKQAKTKDGQEAGQA